MKKISFEWDSKKAQTNLKKHGVSFEAAHYAFYDENALEYFDPDHSVDEDRFILLGLSMTSQILVVSYCIRIKNRIRIISARKATKKESEYYFRRFR